MKKYICDCCKKDMPDGNLVKIEARRYICYPGYRGMSNSTSFDLCFGCYDKIFEPVLSKRKQNEEGENNDKTYDLR